MSERTLTRADNGASIEVKPGDKIVIRLTENPTTGYGWGIEEMNSDVVTPEGSAFSRAPAAEIGGGGERTLTFSARSVGTTPLRLKYWRDWVGDNSITERFAVDVHVREESPEK